MFRREGDRPVPLARRSQMDYRVTDCVAESQLGFAL